MKAAAAAAGPSYLPDLDKQAFVQRHKGFFLSLKSVAEDEGLDPVQKGPIDLWQAFFPNLLAGDTKNIPRRNDLILTSLLKRRAKAR